MAKKAAKKAAKSKKQSVRVIADGSNQLTLVFPKPSSLTGKAEVSRAAVMKLLMGSSKGEVSGQCWGECSDCCCNARIVAIAGVRG
ncbi:MAG: hypothetical protein ABSA67_05790 [Candidatus Brocadiia bacterium]|jgi:hypothetical protein